MENSFFDKNVFVPPCGINCKKCPNSSRSQNPCKGLAAGCKTRKCKGIYVCCVEKQQLEFCFQCRKFPCSRFRKFSKTWLKYGQDLMLNQEQIKNYGKEFFLMKF